MHNTPHLRKAYIWNTVASMTYASMSFLMTLVIVRQYGAEAGGVFSIAFSSAQMMQAIAAFGMRNYQATDVAKQFKFSEYISSRIATSVLMAAMCGLYAWLMHFEGEKLAVYLLFCGVKLFEGLADIFEGMLHQHNRLDLAAQALFLRSLLIIVVFIAALLASCQIVTASFLAFLTSGICFFLCAWPMSYKFERPQMSIDCRRVCLLLLQCLPLFATSVAKSYVNNAPKIAIEWNMNDLVQARFAIIYMPAWVIGLLSDFIFRPQLNAMAVYYHSREKAPFQRVIRAMVVIDVGITCTALIGTYFFGVPVLSWIYGVNIAGEKAELLLVVFSGGLCALAGLMSQALTVLRQQGKLLIGNLIDAFVPIILANYLVRTCGIMGAVWSYLTSMVVLLAALALIYITCMKRFESNEEKNRDDVGI